jgi:hypothetical protein
VRNNTISLAHNVHSIGLNEQYGRSNSYQSNHIELRSTTGPSILLDNTTSSSLEENQLSITATGNAAIEAYDSASGWMIQNSIDSHNNHDISALYFERCVAMVSSTKITADVEVLSLSESQLASDYPAYILSFNGTNNINSRISYSNNVRDIIEYGFLVQSQIWSSVRATVTMGSPFNYSIYQERYSYDQQGNVTSSYLDEVKRGETEDREYTINYDLVNGSEVYVMTFYAIDHFGNIYNHTTTYHFIDDGSHTIPPFLFTSSDEVMLPNPLPDDFNFTILLIALAIVVVLTLQRRSSR